MGDVLQVLSFASHSLCYIDNAFKIYSVPMEANRCLLSHDVPARIIAAGRLSDVRESMDTFTMTITQMIAPGNFPAELIIEGIMFPDPGWQDSALLSTASNSSFSFIGDILAVDDGDVIVAVNSVTLLPPLFVPLAAPLPLAGLL